MKGRQTSYQRFSSVLGTTGSVVNKFFRSLGKTPNGRDSELSNTIQIDSSDNKGIYNKTLRVEDDLTYDYDKEDLGEEVYGCISHPFGENSIYIEKDSETAIEGRKTKRANSPHFKDKKRKWYDEKSDKTYEECALIPQENVPLAVNSKFEMKFWEAETEKTTTIPKGIGFTSGSLVRPISFIEEAKRIENGWSKAQKFSWEAYGSLSGRSHILRGVPLEIAHKLINCCKEIELKGDVNYSIKRTSKKCATWDGNEEGPSSTQKEWEGEQIKGCPPGTCSSIGGNQTANCISNQQVTTIKLNGKLDMTAYRHKQVADIWGKEPKVLDISGNYFVSSFEKPALRKISRSECVGLDFDSGPIPTTKLPDPTIKQVLEFETQTKLSSGCLSYPSTNNSMIIAKEEDSLKTGKLDGYTEICEPDSAKTYNYLFSTAQMSWALFNGYPRGNTYPSGIQMRNPAFSPNSASAVRPFYVSGPSLHCSFGGMGWDYSEIGKKEPEVPWHQDDCGKYPSNYKDWKMTWNSTKLKKTFEGDCAQGFNGFDRYDRKKNNCNCGDKCKDCKADWGKLKLLCECEPQCQKADHFPLESPENPNPCAGPYISNCDGMCGFSLFIGKYVGVQVKDSPYAYNVAPVPLTTKVEPRAQEDLVLWFDGFISDVLDTEFFPNYSLGLGSGNGLQLSIYPNQESVDIALAGLPENSLIRYEKKSVGSVTLTLDDWSNSFPIWVILPIRKETTCTTGPTTSTNTQSTLVEGSPYNSCVDCIGELPDCCSEQGCGGVSSSTQCCNEADCGINDPCGLAIYVSPSKGQCDDNAEKTCGGGCVDVDLSECGCCGCTFNACDPESEDDCFICCPNWKSCKPYKLIKDFEYLSCYGEAHEEDVHEVSIDLTIQFKPFKEME